MSESRRKKYEFFKQHPNCCFCGGAVAAETMDHQPGRVFFLNREWPEGFVFPACIRCNEWSRENEKVMSLLIHGDAEHDGGRYLATVKSLSRTYPKLIDSMLPEHINETRRILRKFGIERPSNRLIEDLGVIKLDASFWSKHFDDFGRKIALALHYQCFGHALPPIGGVKTWTATNADFDLEGRFDAIKELTTQLAQPKRNKRMLNDQFAIRWSFNTNPNTGLFICHFHSKIYLTCITSENTALLNKIGDYFGPLNHQDNNPHIS